MALVLAKTPDGQVLHFGPHFWATVKVLWRVADAQSAVAQKSPASVTSSLMQFDYVVMVAQDLYAQIAS